MEIGELCKKKGETIFFLKAYAVWLKKDPNFNLKTRNLRLDQLLQYHKWKVFPQVEEVPRDIEPLK